MKRIFLALLVALVSVSTFAQFEKKTKYANISLSGLQLQYSRNNKFSLGVQATGGYFFADDWMVLGKVGYDYAYASGKRSTFGFGGAARYYFRQNGIFLQAGLSYDHQSWKADALVPVLNDEGLPELVTHSTRLRANNIYFTPEIGYCFYLNHFFSLEPSLYYDVSLNHVADYSRFGLRLSAGFYF